MNILNNMLDFGNTLCERSAVMNKNAELLNYVYQNSQMGINTVKQLLEMVDEGEFKDYLSDHLSGYEEINREARELLAVNGYDEKGLSTLEKIATYVAVNMKTMTDKGRSHIAQMLIEGSNMGVVQGTKKLNDYQDAEHCAQRLMNKLVKFEEKNMQALKKFL